MNALPEVPITDLAEMYLNIAKYFTYLRIAVPALSVVAFFATLYIEPMMKSIVKRLFNRGTLSVQEL